MAISLPPVSHVGRSVGPLPNPFLFLGQAAAAASDDDNDGRTDKTEWERRALGRHLLLVG